MPGAGSAARWPGPAPADAAGSKHCGALLPLRPLQVFNVAGYYGADQAVCSVYALGRLGGTVVDIGYGKIGAVLL